MTDSPESSPVERVAPEGIESPTKDHWATVKGVATWMYAVAMVAIVAGLLFVNSVWQPKMGQSLNNVVTYALIQMALILTIGWGVIFSAFRWRTIWMVGAALLVMVGGAYASIRQIEFDGNMGLVVHYRWNETAEERLAAHRAKVAAPATQGTETAPESESIELPVISEHDMPAYRGVNRDGIVNSPPLIQDFDAQPPKPLFSQPCGGGYAAFVVARGRAMTIEQRGEKEAVVCYDALTGAEYWVHEYPADFQEAMGGPGPRATPTIAGDEVFSLGAEGELVCLDLATGKPRWRVDVLPEGSKNVEWALSSSPLVLEDRVIVEVGGPEGDGLIACDRATGETLWKRPGIDRLSEPEAKNHAGYSSPVLVNLHEVPQVIIFDGEGLRSHDPQTGQELWFHEFKNDPRVNVAQPLFLKGDRIFLSQSYTVGCRMIELSHDAGEWQTSTLWENINMKCKFTSPVLHDGYLYGLDEGILVCLDPETGKRKWKKGRYGHGQILLTNGQIVVLTERGDVVLVEASPEKFTEITRFAALPSPKVWNPPALANGRIYVRNHESMSAFDISAESSAK